MTMNDLLVRLNQLDWNHYQSLCGDSVTIPSLISDLKAPQMEIAIQALFELQRLICHSATVCEVTPVMIPFLLELITDTELECRARIIELLGHILQAKTALEGNLSSQEILHKNYDLIWNARHLFEGFLSDNDPSLRMVTPYLLASLHAASDENRYRNTLLWREQLTHQLWMAIERETTPLVLGSLLFAMTEIAPDTSKLLPFLEQLATSTTQFEVQLSAIINCIHVSGKVSEFMLTPLTKAILDYNTTIRYFLTNTDWMDYQYHPRLKGINENALGGNVALNGYFPWIESLAMTTLLAYLCKFDSTYLSKLIPTFKAVLSQANEHTLATLGDPIMRYLWIDGKEATEKLTPYQQQLVEVLFYNPFIWANYNGNVSQFLATIGLPQRREEWYPLLEIDSNIPPSAEQCEEMLRQLIKAKLNIQEEYHEFTSIELTQIKTLSLRHIGTDHYLSNLHQFPALQAVDLSMSSISASGIMQLPISLPLRDLQLAGIKLSEAALQHIAKFTTLERLNISNSQCQEAWLKHLSPLKHLKTLILFKLPLSETTIAMLKDQLPDCMLNLAIGRRL